MGRINIWVVLLLVSVLINGVLIGAAARDGFAPQAAPAAPLEAARGERRRGFDMRRFVEALPEQTRAEARGRLDAARPELRGLTREMIEARRNALRVLAEEEFDVEQADAALAEARRARADLEAATEHVVLESVADLDAATRRHALREALGGERFRARSRRGDWDDARAPD
ncbi:MAG: periplasmic heavy metal sensor [Oceanicaulis sp.]